MYLFILFLLNTPQTSFQKKKKTLPKQKFAKKSELITPITLMPKESHLYNMNSITKPKALQKEKALNPKILTHPRARLTQAQSDLSNQNQYASSTRPSGASSSG